MPDQGFADRICRIETGKQWEPEGVTQARAMRGARRRGINAGYWKRYLVAVSGLAALMIVLIEAGAVPELAEAAEAAGQASIIGMIVGA